MKRIIRLGVFAVVATLLYLSNPAEPAFERFLQEQIEQRLSEETGDGRLGRLITRMGSSVVGSMALRASSRTNYRFWSIYRVDVGGDGNPDESWVFLGIANQFLELSSPNSD